MQTRKLGPEGLAVSALGLGCWGMSQAYGPASPPLGRGFLTCTVATETLTPQDLRHSDPRFWGDHGEHNRTLVGELERLAAERGATPAQLALAWLLAQGDDVVPIPGTKRIDRLEENAAAADLTLTNADLDRLEAAAPRGAWAGDRSAFAAYRTTRTPAGTPVIEGAPPGSSPPTVSQGRGLSGCRRGAVR